MMNVEQFKLALKKENIELTDQMLEQFGLYFKLIEE